jgi:hypothetical protein
VTWWNERKVTRSNPRAPISPQRFYLGLYPGLLLHFRLRQPRTQLLEHRDLSAHCSSTSFHSAGLFDRMADMERRLLLDDDIEDNPTPVEQRMKRATPLPKAQLAVVFAAKLGVTLSAQQATPYLNEMLGRLSGGRSSRVGFAAGLVWTAYCAPQLLGVYPWGRTSGTCISRAKKHNSYESCYR